MEPKNKKLITFIVIITLLAEAISIFAFYTVSTAIMKAFEEGFSSAFQFIGYFLMWGVIGACIVGMLKSAIEIIKYIVGTDEGYDSKIALYKYYEENKDKGFPLMTPTFFADGEADDPKNSPMAKSSLTTENNSRRNENE